METANLAMHKALVEIEDSIALILESPYEDDTALQSLHVAFDTIDAQLDSRGFYNKGD